MSESLIHPLESTMLEILQAFCFRHNDIPIQSENHRDTLWSHRSQGTGLARKKKFSSCDGHPTNHTRLFSSNLGSLKTRRDRRKGAFFQLDRCVWFSAGKHHQERGVSTWLWSPSLSSWGKSMRSIWYKNTDFYVKWFSFQTLGCV